MPTRISIDDLLAKREAYDLEVKAAQGRDGRGEVPTSVWETYSAFANTEGGYILLGAQEDSEGGIDPIGIEDIERVRRDFWNGLNNPQNVNTNLLSNEDVEVVDVDDATLLLVHVPRAPRQRRPVFVGLNPFGGTFRRFHEGDYRCDEATVRRIISEAEIDHPDAHILIGYSTDDLDADSLKAYRNLFRSASPDHPWLALDDAGLLQQLGAWRRDRDSGMEGLTLAGLLMFGRLRAILDAVPTYLVDYRELPEAKADPSQRWLDRVTTDGTWAGNLFSFYRKVYGKLVSEIKIPFRLEGGRQRIDETHVHEALREALVNTLIHADYGGSTGILVLKEPGRFTFRNPGTLRIPQEQAFEGGNSDCRNRSLQKMFQLIGAGEQAGSGLPRILRAWQEQHWRRPILRDFVNPECTKLSLPTVSLFPRWAIDELEGRFGAAFVEMREHERLAVATALIEGHVTNRRLQDLTEMHPTDITAVLRRLVEAGHLIADGEGRGRSYTLPGDPVAKISVLPSAEQVVMSPGNHTDRTASSTESSTDLGGRSTEKSTDLGGSSTENFAESSTEEDSQLRLNFDDLERLDAISAPVRGRNLPREIMADVIVQLTAVRWMNKQEIADQLGKSSRTIEEYLTELLAAGRIKPRYENPNDPRQSYKAVGAEDGGWER